MNVLVFTSSRAEYGILSNLIKKLNNSKAINLKLIVSGSHLSKKYGYTISEIIKDKVRISKKIKLDYKDTKDAQLNNFNLILKNLFNFISKNNTDLLLILGDRYEILAAAIAAMLSKIKIAHLHGGEVTQGAIDERIRHSISKMSDIHLVSTKNYKKRLIQLGESPSRVYHVGAICNDNINNIKKFSKKRLEKDIGFKFKKRNIIVTLHPETTGGQFTEKKIKIFFKTLSKLKNVGIIATYPNIDAGNQLILKYLEKFAKENNNVKIIKSLGAQNYLKSLKICDGIIGNSSSGLLESPLLKKGSINVGLRQKGRDTCGSVIDTDFDSKKIYKALKKIFSKKFKNNCKKVKSPYIGKNVSHKIYKIIKSQKVQKLRNDKVFYDLR